jgi:hypothetical protein
LELSKNWIGLACYNLEHYGCHRRYSEYETDKTALITELIQCHHNYEGYITSKTLKNIAFLINDAVLKFSKCYDTSCVAVFKIWKRHHQKIIEDKGMVL